MANNLVAGCVLVSGLGVVVAGVAGVAVGASSADATVPVALWVGLSCLGTALIVVSLNLLVKNRRQR